MPTWRTNEAGMRATAAAAAAAGLCPRLGKLNRVTAQDVASRKGIIVWFLTEKNIYRGGNKGLYVVA